MCADMLWQLKKVVAATGNGNVAVNRGCRHAAIWRPEKDVILYRCIFKSDIQRKID